MSFGHEGHHHGQTHSQAEKEMGSTSREQQVFAEIEKEYESVLQPVLAHKCASCHDSTTQLPWYGEIPILALLIKGDRDEALDHLDIPKGFPFAGHGTPIEDLEALSNVAKHNSMPPPVYSFFIKVRT